MLIKTLVENTAMSEELGCEHGLSLYIETGDHKILFDLGAGDLFYENALKLGVDITAVDFVIISHGHYDHGGGLKRFLRENNRAKVFVHERAFDKHSALGPDGETINIGLEEELRKSGQIVLSSDGDIIAEGLRLFSKVELRGPLPKANEGLWMERQGQMLSDSFEHEQNLIIEEGDVTVLLTGCAHRGIVNIVGQFYKTEGRMPDYIIGGFHLFRPMGKDNVDLEEVGAVSNCLLQTKARCYTGHCTGKAAYQVLKELMGESIDYLHTGSELKI